ncbi:hypothetical protein [Tahibacter soli]|uniref:Peptidase C51 domain-containing protein n=1 Tax=Tahibacter soli TaxID=2983605 RepID=A0A9X3YM65_9GAMM|nr:hypothetical protein [Tahibacter soli]MDC8014961.1 hypothetical protein [Tahibacter soli]
MTNKCNLFIHEVLDAAGADIPYMNGGLLYNWFGIGSPEYPVLAGQWADRNFKIPGWTIVESPQAGDIGAMSLPFRDATGHVGIIANGSGGGFLTISASSVSHSVVKNDWGFRNDGWKLIYRRYTGEGK